MKFSIAAVASLGANLAAALPQESKDFPFPKSDSLEITELSLRRGSDNQVKSVSFKANGTEIQDLTCTAENPDYSVHLKCKEDPWYRFIVEYPGRYTATVVQSIYFMHIYNPGGSSYFDPGVGGYVEIPITCEKKDGDDVCKQIETVTVRIS
ncbi:hypothetical protein HJFPF1_12204 [Paramyrothecium foliicola]|nr:hypothetical protein HJFPF1_12204 [Paramyrothecium foliicola]